MTEKIELKNSKNQEMKINQENLLQITVLGTDNAGKTILLNKLLGKSYETENIKKPVETFQYKYEHCGKECHMNFFDTCWKEEYFRFRTLTLKISNVVIICYDVNSLTSFNEIEASIIFMVRQRIEKDTEILLCATKIDLREGTEDEDSVSISTKEGSDLAKKIGASEFFECSGKTGEGVEEIMEYLKKVQNKDVAEIRRFSFFCCS